jgi:hypothetical protein
MDSKFKNPQQIVKSFDMSHIKFAYNGKEISGTWEAWIAFFTGKSMSGPSTEGYRIVKGFLSGYDMIGYDWSIKDIYSKLAENKDKIFKGYKLSDDSLNSPYNVMATFYEISLLAQVEFKKIKKIGDFTPNFEFINTGYIKNDPPKQLPAILHPMRRKIITECERMICPTKSIKAVDRKFICVCMLYDVNYIPDSEGGRYARFAILDLEADNVQKIIGHEKAYSEKIDYSSKVLFSCGRSCDILKYGGKVHTSLSEDGVIRARIKRTSVLPDILSNMPRKTPILVEFSQIESVDYMTYYIQDFVNLSINPNVVHYELLPEEKQKTSCICYEDEEDDIGKLILNIDKNECDEDIDGILKLVTDFDDGKYEEETECITECDDKVPRFTDSLTKKLERLENVLGPDKYEEKDKSKYDNIIKKVSEMMSVTDESLYSTTSSASNSYVKGASTNIVYGPPMPNVGRNRSDNVAEWDGCLDQLLG